MLGKYVALTANPWSDHTTSSTNTLVLTHTQPQRSTPHLILRMANRGYDVVVDVDAEVSTPIHQLTNVQADINRRAT
jgi:hypothetical protein